MFSVNHLIVSQTHPHIVPILNLKRRLGVAGAVAESELKHRCARACASRGASPLLAGRRLPARAPAQLSVVAMLEPVQPQVALLS